MAQGIVARMYKTTIVLLILVVATSSYYLHQFPYSVVTAVIACSVIEAAVRKLHHKRKYEVSYTAIITGIIIGSVASSNTALIVLLLASAVAVLSKFFIRIKGTNVFNPASLGLLVSLALFGMGDNWWVAAPYSVYGTLIAITPLLALCAWEARRLFVGISFAVTAFIMPLLLNGLAGTGSLAALWTAIISVNYFQAFVMASEPKTSPHKKHAQIVYGVSVAVMVSLLSFYRVPYALLLPLLIGNIAYAVYRMKTGSR